MANKNDTVESDYSETCDDECLKTKIKSLLRKYFDCNDNGDPNPQSDPNYAAQDLVNDLHDLVGDI